MRKNSNTKSTPKIIIVNGERIFTTNIETYSISQTTFKYRNHEKNGLFKLTDKIFSDYHLNYLYIKLYNGTRYYIYSDKSIAEKIERTERHFQNYFSQLDSDKPYKEIQKIKTSFTFVEEDINEIVKKIDSAFDVL